MRSLLVLLLTLIALPAFAVTRDAKTGGEKGNSGTTLTVSHTVTSSGGNRAIYVLCGLRNRTITATATYAGQSMTEVAGAAHSSTNLRTYVFRKSDPTTGANNWVVTQSSGTAMVCWALSATDVNQSTPETSTDNTCSGGNSPSLTLTTANDELLLDVYAMPVTSAGTATEGADQIEEHDQAASENTLTVTGSRQSGADGGVMSYSGSGGSTCYSAISIAHSAFSTGSGAPKRRAH